MGLFLKSCAPKTPQASFKCSSIFFTMEWAYLSIFTTILRQKQEAGRWGWFVLLGAVLLLLFCGGVIVRYI